MQPAYFSATVVAMTLILSATVIYLTQWLSKILKSQREILLTTQNLLASKNLETFQRLQWTNHQTSQSQSEPAEVLPILSDEELALKMAADYEARGIDPNRAFNQEDIDFRSEFGI